LDKILEHQKVIKHFIKLQLQYLRHGKPNEFLKTDLDINLFNLTLQQQLSTVPGGGTTIPLVSCQNKTMVTKYRKDVHLS